MDTQELARLGMQIAFGRVRRKTSPATVKFQAVLCSDVFGLYYNLILSLLESFWLLVSQDLC